MTATLEVPVPPAGPDPYDVNFCFPVRELENERVKLTPFIPSIHADLFFRGSSTLPDFYQHLPFGPYSSSSAFTESFIYGRIQPDPGQILYAIIDKTRTQQPAADSDMRVTDGTTTDATPASISIRGPSPSPADFAGTIGYIHGSSEHLRVEIGLVMILPLFRRTHVTTHAVGLLVRHALDSPVASPPGLGLRRVQWRASERNGASIRVAERMGFRMEANFRWDRVVSDCGGRVRDGGGMREGDARPGTLAMHTVLLAICWDDWENGGKERVSQLMDR